MAATLPTADALCYLLSDECANLWETKCPAYMLNCRDLYVRLELYQSVNYRLRQGLNGNGQKFAVVKCKRPESVPPLELMEVEV
jgi:hypothetical protein